MYLVVINMWGYRDSLRDKNIKDELWLCRRNALLWETYIPANARIRVSGIRVFAVYKRKRHLIHQPINIPRHFGKPIGKVSTLADYDGRGIINDK